MKHRHTRATPANVPRSRSRFTRRQRRGVGVDATIAKIAAFMRTYLPPPRVNGGPMFELVVPPELDRAMRARFVNSPDLARPLGANEKMFFRGKPVVVNPNAVRWYVRHAQRLGDAACVTVEDDPDKNYVVKRHPDGSMFRETRSRPASPPPRRSSPASPPAPAPVAPGSAPRA